MCAIITYYSVYEPVAGAGSYSGSNYLLHGLAYFGLSAVLVMHFHPTKHGIMESVILASAVGVGIELIQFNLTHRTFSVLDMMANTLGASLIIFDYHGFAVDKMVHLEDKMLNQVSELNEFVQSESPRYLSDSGVVFCSMKEGDLVLIDYVGRADGEIFDLTLEEKAKENDMMRQDVDYKQVPVLIGKEYVIEGLEEAVKSMEVGDEKEIEVASEKAYGPRDSDNVKTYPEKEFKKQDIQVRPGEELMIGNRRGKVVSKGSGRVRIDFNHPLSGKDLEYWVRVNEKVEEGEEIAKHIYNYRIGEGDIEFEDGTVKIPSTHNHGDHEHELPEEAKDNLRDEIEEHTDLEVEFVEK